MAKLVKVQMELLKLLPTAKKRVKKAKKAAAAR